MSTTKTWLITGASRGVGLEYARQLLNDPHNRVVAGAREPEGEGLQQLHELHGDRLLRVRTDVHSAATLSVRPRSLPALMPASGDAGCSRRAQLKWYRNALVLWTTSSTMPV